MFGIHKCAMCVIVHSACYSGMVTTLHITTRSSIDRGCSEMMPLQVLSRFLCKCHKPANDVQLFFKYDRALILQLCQTLLGAINLEFKLFCHSKFIYFAIYECMGHTNLS